jgi:uncharacterized membrane protein
MTEAKKAMGLLSRAVSSVARAVTALPSWGVLFVALGWLPGIAIWQVARHHGPTFSISSKGVKVLLQKLERVQAMNYGWSTLVFLAGVYLVLFLLARRRDRTRSYDRYFASLNRKFLVLLSLPLFAAIFTTNFESKHQILNLTLIALTVSIVGAWFYSLAGSRRTLDALPSPEQPWGRETTFAPWLLVGAFVFGYSYVLSRLSIIDHWNLNTANWDLGIYHNIMWNSANGDFLGCSFCRGDKHYSAHFDPILWMLTPVYRLSPRAETLLVIQSVWLALGAVPLFLHARRVLGSGWWACTIVAAYCFMPALHGANLYDFHSLALLVPTAMFAIYFLDAERPLGYWLSIALLLLTREDMSLLSCFIGLYAWFTGKQKTGLATMIVAVAYLVTVKMTIMAPGLIMDSSSEAKSYAWYYKEAIPYADQGAWGLITTLLSDPVASLAILLSEEKMLFFAKLLWPLLLLPLISGKKRILMIYGVVFIGLATRKYLYSTHFQYSCLLLPFLAISVADAVALMRDASWVRGFRLDSARLQRALLATLVVSSALMGAEYGVLAPNESMRAGWSRIAWAQTDTQREQYEEMLDMKAKIPPEASVSADSRTGPHVTDRAVVEQWPYVGTADYIFMMKRSARGKSRKKYNRILDEEKFEVVNESKRFVLLRRLERSSDPEKADDREDQLDAAHQNPEDEGDDPPLRNGVGAGEGSDEDRLPNTDPRGND